MSIYPPTVGLTYFVGSMAEPTFAECELVIPDLGMLLSPSSWRTPYCRFACDNDVFAAFLQGRLWDSVMERRWLRMLEKADRYRPLLVFVLLPDAVGDWARTVELARIYAPMLRAMGLPFAIALQDGCDFEEALSFGPAFVFVAGSTEWKVANIEPAAKFFRPHGVGVHVGRVNTLDRLKLCLRSCVDSCDGTGLNKFRNEMLRRLGKVLNPGPLFMETVDG